MVRLGRAYLKIWSGSAAGRLVWISVYINSAELGPARRRRIFLAFFWFGVGFCSLPNSVLKGFLCVLKKKIATCGGVLSKFVQQQQNRRFAANSSKLVDSRSKFSSLIFIRNRCTVYKSERITHAATRRENKPHEVVKRRNTRNSIYRITWIFIQNVPLIQNVTLFVTRI